MTELTPTAPLTTADAVNWDAELDNAFNLGPLNRLTQVGDWQVVVGLDVSLRQTLGTLPLRPGKLMVIAENLLLEGEIDLNQYSEVMLIGLRLLQTNQPKLRKNLRSFGQVARESSFHDEGFGICVYGAERRSVGGQAWVDIAGSTSFQCSGKQFSDYSIALFDNQLVRRMIGFHYVEDIDPRPFWTFDEHFDETSLASPILYAAYAPIMERQLLAVQSLADQGKTALAHQLLDRFAATARLLPAGTVADDLWLTHQLTREALQPLQPTPDHVPYLSSALYADLATVYSLPLTQYATTFRDATNRALDLEARKSAARRILDDKSDAISFLTLVDTQSKENLAAVNRAVTKAQQSIERQQARVATARTTFETGLEDYKEQQKREAAMAIIGGIFSFVTSFATGNPAGATADIAQKLSKLAELMQKLEKIGKIIIKLAELGKKIYDNAQKITSSKQFAADMASVTQASMSDDAKDAPSAGAYWDQLWVEVETQLAPAIKAEIGGADEYLKELKILVIYGRALTTAQAGILPLAQEIARTALQKENAARQQESITREINSLQAQQAIPARAMSTLWLGYRSVQRAMLLALQNFDAAHRYWALADEPKDRRQDRAAADCLRELLAVADIREQQAKALGTFVPPPQEYRGERMTVPAVLVEQFLRPDGGSLSLRLTPTNSPFNGRGRVGRVRVSEIRVWLEWHEGKKPTSGEVELTIRTTGLYDDQLLQKNDQLRAFHFVAEPLNMTFRYDPKKDDGSHPEAAIKVPARIAEDFRRSYSEPALFAEWQITLPKGTAANTLDLAALRPAVRGIQVEFFGTFIKDKDRFF